MGRAVWPLHQLLSLFNCSCNNAIGPTAIGFVFGFESLWFPCLEWHVMFASAVCCARHDKVVAALVLDSGAVDDVEAAYDCKAFLGSIHEYQGGAPPCA